MNFPESGILILDGVIPQEINQRLKEAFFKCYSFCRPLQEKYGLGPSTENTIHHTFFMDDVFSDVFELNEYFDSIEQFFEGKKFILNSLGGNNNIGKVNYASNIHRDVRFYTQDPLMLNTILAVTGYTDENGPTEFLPGSQNNPNKPSDEIFNNKKQSFTCSPGSIILFDSRIWHRAGIPSGNFDERIIFTPIFSRPFIKQGFNYARQLSENGANKYSDKIKQIVGYHSDVPTNHDEWYNINERRFYKAGQDD